jgi:dTDP-4-dehydrorhamnose reductase
MSSARMRILLIGGNGQVGWELQRTLAPLGEVAAPPREDLDLAREDSIRTYMAVNGVAPGILAEAARQQGAALIHYSTDYVFDGEKTVPYRETDAPQPVNTYGKTKLAGEQALEAVGGSYLILRTSWVYGLRGRNFLVTIRRLAWERDVLKVVDDQQGAPTWSRMIAEATAQIIAQARGQVPDFIGQYRGVYHLSCGGETSWYDFADAILRWLDSTTAPRARLEPIPTSDYPTPARRPAFSCLDNTQLQSTFGVKLPDWQGALKLALLSG